MVEINNLTRLKIDEKFLKKVAGRVLAEEKKKTAGLSLAFVGPERIKKLNKKYLGKNRPTDVLAFGGEEMLSLKWKAQKPFKEGGEIVICLDKVKKNSARFKFAFKKELAMVLIHGILHLLGYDHERGAACAKKMNKKQEYYLNLFFK
jgi:probable rRNA maturation factor